MHVRFSVQINDEPYSFQGDYGEAESKIEVPQELLEHIEVGEIFKYLVTSALNDYHQKKNEKKLVEE